MNKIKKGYRVEKRCSDELRAAGYITWKTVRVAYCKLDLFELFDVLARSKDGDQLLFIQAKSNRVDNETRNKIRDFKLPPGCQKWIWIWRDQRGWIKEYYE